MSTRSAILTAAVLTLAACVSSGPESQLGKQDKAPRRIEMTRTTDCVFQSTIQDFDALDDRYVVLFSMGRRKAYLAELTGGCFDVRYQVRLAAVDGDRNGQICGFGRDSIAYERMGLVENCRIMALQELSDERRAELGIAGPPPRPKKDDRDQKDEKDGGNSGEEARQEAPQ